MFTMQSARPLAIQMIKALASNWESGCLVFWVSFWYSISFRRSFGSHSRMIDVLKWSIQYPINWTMWGWFNLTKKSSSTQKDGSCSCPSQFLKILRAYLQPSILISMTCTWSSSCPYILRAIWIVEGSIWRYLGNHCTSHVVMLDFTPSNWNRFPTPDICLKPVWPSRQNKCLDVVKYGPCAIQEYLGFIAILHYSEY